MRFKWNIASSRHIVDCKQNTRTTKVASQILPNQIPEEPLALNRVIREKQSLADGANHVCIGISREGDFELLLE
jgi:hypothetical protein